MRTMKKNSTTTMKKCKNKWSSKMRKKRLVGRLNIRLPSHCPSHRATFFFKILQGEFEDPDGPVEEEARYEDVLSVCLSRFRLEKWHLEPYFEQVVPGCFIRVPMTDDGEERLYKIFQIESVLEDLDKPFYKFGGRNNSAYKYVRVELNIIYSPRGLAFIISGV